MANYALRRRRLCCPRLNRSFLGLQSTAVLIRFTSLGVLFLLCSLLIDGCHHGRSEPSVEFTKIPMSAVGGLDNMDTIEGRVTSVRPEQRVVLYAKSGGRW